MQMELDQLLHVEQVDSLEQWEQLIHFMIIQMLFYMTTITAMNSHGSRENSSRRMSEE